MENVWKRNPKTKILANTHPEKNNRKKKKGGYRYIDSGNEGNASE